MSSRKFQALWPSRIHPKSRSPGILGLDPSSFITGIRFVPTKPRPNLRKKEPGIPPSLLRISGPLALERPGDPRNKGPMPLHDASPGDPKPG